MKQRLPNLLTVFRLILAAAFLIILGQYRYPAGDAMLLWVSMIVFIVAAVTDFLDGYLARKWRVESAFGRVMDPLGDKVLVLGAFLFLAGPRFAIPADLGELITGQREAQTITGVYPWMVVVMLVRELLVTALRGEMEKAGVKAGAMIWGKLKTVLQLITVPVVLVVAALLDERPTEHTMLLRVRDAMVYLTVLVTVASGVPYVQAMVKAMVKREE